MTKAEFKLNDIYIYLLRRNSVTAADRMIAPLSWYIMTARASVSFLHAFYECKPFIIGRILERHEFRPYSVTLEAIKKRIMKGGEL